MDNFIIIILCFLWLYCFYKKGALSAVSFLFIASTIAYFLFASNNIDVVLKALFAITYSLMLFKKRHKSGLIILVYLLLVFAIYNGTNAHYDSLYKPKDCFTAYFSFFIGIFAQLLFIDLNGCKKLLRVLSKLSIYSLVLGIPLAILGLKDYTGRWGTAIAGASLSTDLSFFGTIGAASAMIYYKLENDIKYRYLAYFNFLVVCSTLTRGGILATSIILLYDLIPFFFSLLRKTRTVFYLLITTVAAIPIFSYIIIAVLERNANGDSGRSEAWGYLLLLQENLWIGNGYGFLKTRDDNSISAFTAAHNEYLHLYVEVGLVGMIIVLIFFFFLFRKILKNTCFFPKKMLLLIFIAFLTYSYTDNTITNFRFWIPFMTLMAILVNINSKIYIKK